MTTLSGKVVLVTGAAGGFGQSLTKLLLGAGSRLVLADLDEQVLRERSALTLKAAGIEHLGDNVLGYVGADLAIPDGPQRLFEACQAVAPEADILINNAGMAMSGWFLDVPRERWEALLQVNLLAAMRLTELFAPAMVRRGGGHVVNISSVAGFVGTPGLAAYSTAKFGLRGFSEALAAELKRHGVQVTGVYPFFARTPILNSPHFGAMPRGSLPDRMLYDPDRVMAAVLRGIERNATHIYPDPTARLLDVLQRIAPWLVRRMNRVAPSA
jgi:NAD(P)-dependent dehydrogenase (short-subunit alcohol dehydrogenase family)